MAGKEALFADPSWELCQARGWGTTSGHTARSQLCRGPALWAWIALLLEGGVSSLLGCSFPGPRERLLMLGAQPGARSFQFAHFTDAGPEAPRGYAVGGQEGGEV